MPGSTFTPMPGLGHFPATENYPAFREYLLPVLDEIAEKAARDTDQEIPA